MDLNIYENANMTLRTYDANVIATNNVSFTWNNINLQNILGELYFKHDKFRLVLNYVCSKNQGSFASNDDSNLVLYMSGLPFERSYNYNAKTDIPKIAIGCMKLISSNGYITNTSLGFVFRKMDGLHNITIELMKAIDGTQSTTKTYGDLTFNFSIYGI